MLKKRQKLKKIKQKKAILMSEKISAILMNKGFSWKYGMVKVVYLLKQGLQVDLESLKQRFSDG